MGERRGDGKNRKERKITEGTGKMERVRKKGLGLEGRGVGRRKEYGGKIVEVERKEKGEDGKNKDEG